MGGAMDTTASPAQQPAGLLRSRDFRLLLAGQTVSQLGSQISAVAMSLVAVVTLHATPFEVGLVGAAATVAFAVIGLPAGAWCDRVRRRPVLVASELVRGLSLASVPLAALFGVLSVAQLVAVAFVVGVARVFFDVAYPSYLPSLVGGERVLAGNATLETVRATGQVAGPGLGGFLVGLLSAATVVWADVVSYVLSAAALASIRTPEPAPPGRSAARLRTRIREGLAFVLGEPVLRAIAVAGAMSNVAFAAVSAVMFVFLVRDLRLPPAAIGLILSGGSLAAMLGAAAAPLLARRFGSARIVWLSLAATAPFTLLVPLAQPGWRVGLFVAGSTLSELGQIVYSVTNLSLRQRICPGHLLGRMNATMRVLIMGTLPLGGLAGGALGEVFGVRAALWIIAPLLALSFVPLLGPLWRVREVTELARPSTATS
jgi:MFS family permease